MIGFIIKKAFFDTWDHLIKVEIFNFMTIPFLFMTYLGLKILGSGSNLGFLIIFVALVCLVIHLGTLSYVMKDIGNNQFESMKDYFKYLKKDLSVKIKFAIAWSLFIIALSFSIIYYLNGDGVLSLISLALLFWFFITTSIAMLLYFPIKARLEGDFRRVIKKCFMLFLDNPLTGIFVFIYALVLLVVSIPSLGLLPPGLASIMCLLDTAVHMYELKYDYLELNPEADKKDIPWKELTYDLNEIIGPRSIRSLIFPWKD